MNIKVCQNIYQLNVYQNFVVNRMIFRNPINLVAWCLYMRCFRNFPEIIGSIKHQATKLILRKIILLTYIITKRKGLGSARTSIPPDFMTPYSENTEAMNAEMFNSDFNQESEQETPNNVPISKYVIWELNKSEILELIELKGGHLCGPMYIFGLVPIIIGIQYNEDKTYDVIFVFKHACITDFQVSYQLDITVNGKDHTCNTKKKISPSAQIVMVKENILKDKLNETAKIFIKIGFDRFDAFDTVGNKLNPQRLDKLYDILNEGTVRQLWNITKNQQKTLKQYNTHIESEDIHVSGIQFKIRISNHQSSKRMLLELECKDNTIYSEIRIFYGVNIPPCGIYKYGYEMFKEFPKKASLFSFTADNVNLIDKVGIIIKIISSYEHDGPIPVKKPITKPIIMDTGANITIKQIKTKVGSRDERTHHNGHDCGGKCGICKPIKKVHDESMKELKRRNSTCSIQDDGKYMKDDSNEYPAIPYGLYSKYATPSSLGLSSAFEPSFTGGIIPSTPVPTPTDKPFFDEDYKTVPKPKNSSNNTTPSDKDWISINVVNNIKKKKQQIKSGVYSHNDKKHTITKSSSPKRAIIEDKILYTNNYNTKFYYKNKTTKKTRKLSPHTNSNSNSYDDNEDTYLVGTSPLPSNYGRRSNHKYYNNNNNDYDDDDEYYDDNNYDDYIEHDYYNGNTKYGKYSPRYNKSLNRQSRSRYSKYDSKYDNNTPPDGYVCHVCNIPGHLKKHCKKLRNSPRNDNHHNRFQRTVKKKRLY